MRKNVFLAAVWVFALSASGLFASQAAAQALIPRGTPGDGRDPGGNGTTVFFPDDDPRNGGNGFDDPSFGFDDGFDDGFGGGTVFRPANDGNGPRFVVDADVPVIEIQRFDLRGDGCPTSTNSTRLFVQAGDGDRQVLTVQFSRNGDVFQVDGPGNVTANCTVRVRLALSQFNDGFDDGTTVFTPDGQQDFDDFNGVSFQLTRLNAGVRFVNDVNQGQISLRTQSRLNDEVGPVRTFTLPNSAQPRFRNVTADNFVETDGNRIDLMTQLQLQLRGNNQAALRLEQLDLEFRVNSGSSFSNF